MAQLQTTGITGSVIVSGSTAGPAGMADNAGAFYVKISDGMPYFSSSQVAEVNLSSSVGGGGSGTVSSSYNGYVGVYTGSSAAYTQGITGSSGLFWDGDNSRLGVGTSSPSTALHVYNATGNSSVLLENDADDVNLILDCGGTNEYPYISLKCAGTNYFNVGVDAANSNNFYIYSSIGTERVLNITTGNNVGIGTSTPIHKFTVAGTASIEGDLYVTGSVIADKYIVSTTYVTSSIIYSSGSTKFGDTSDDTHQFTGSIFLNGVLSSSANISGSAFYGDGSNLTGIDVGDAISFDGSTSNGVLTYKDADEATVESNLTFDGSAFKVSGSTTRLEVTGSDNSILFGVHSTSNANILTVSGSGEISLSGVLSSSANISGSSFYGDGSNLTGISGGSGTVTLIGLTGSSGVTISSTNTLPISGSDQVTFSLGAITPTSVSASANISASSYYGDGSNLQGVTGSGGTVTLIGLTGSNGVTITSTNALPISGSDQVTVTLGAITPTSVSASANISASSYYGDGSNLTGIDTGDAISFDGSTANGVLTYKDADEATVESNLTFDGTTLTLAGTAAIAGNLYVTGSVIADKYVVSTTYITSSILYSSGSTKFGDTSDDAHSFTGSIYVSGGGKVGRLYNDSTYSYLTSTGNLWLAPTADGTIYLNPGSSGLVSVYTGDLAVSNGSISSSAEVSASSFYGDGSNLTGIDVGDAISFDGSTANGVLTYKDADEATVESNLTFDGTTLVLAGTMSASSGISGSSFYGDGSNLSGVSNNSGTVTLIGLTGSNGVTITSTNTLPITGSDQVTITLGALTPTSVSASANISASSFFGDGSSLQGVTGSGGTVTLIGLTGSNGVTITSVNALPISGSDQVTVTLGAITPTSVSASSTISASSFWGDGSNLTGISSASGTVTLIGLTGSNGVTITSTNTLPITGSDQVTITLGALTPTSVSASANISASSFYGDGSILQGVTGSGGTVTLIGLTGSNGVTITSTNALPISGSDQVTITLGALTPTSVSASSTISASSFFGDGSNLSGIDTGDAISFDGSTANGVLTYKDADEATVESNLTFDGTTLALAGTAAIAGNLYVTGSVIADKYVVSTTYITSSIIYSSGSTKFGDTSDDTHVFTGSMTIVNGGVEIRGLLGTDNQDLFAIKEDQYDRFVMECDFNTTGNPIHIKSDARTYLTIKTNSADNEIGFGTTTPSAKLHISGSDNTSLLSCSSDSNASIISVSGSGRVGIGTATPSQHFSVKGANSEFVIYENANDDVRIGTWTDDDISFIVNGSRKATIDGDGKVGIGTSAPGPHKLAIVNTQTDNINSGSLGFFPGGGATYAYNSIRQSATPLADLCFDRNYGGSDSESMRIQRSTGYVGIGTTTPSSSLEISGSDNSSLLNIKSDSFTNIFEISGSSSTTTHVSSSVAISASSFWADGTNIKGTVDYSGTPVDNQVAIWTDVDTLEGTTSLTFDGSILKVSGSTTRLEITGSDNSIVFGVHSATNANILTVTGSGKVGIGTVSPKVALDIHHDPTDPTELTANTGGGEVIKFGNGSTTAGKMYYLNSSGTWVLTDANAVASGASQLLAVALGTAPQTHGMLIRGFFNVSSYLTGTYVTGSAVYVCETTTGNINVAAPDGSGDFVRVVGHAAVSGSIIYFNPSGDWVEM